MTGRVIVVGSINVDLVVAGPRLPAPGETVTGGRFARHHGGKGGNQAVAAARLGAPTVLVAAVGIDDFGRDAIAALVAEGVDVERVAAVAGEPTGVALILVGAAGENLISVASGANAALTPARVAAALADLEPTEADAVLVGHEIPTATAREALRLARAAGARTIFNPAPADGLDRSTFGTAQVLTPNRRELDSLVRAESRRLGRRPTPADDVGRAARGLIERNAEGDGAGAVLVSLGADGALLVAADGLTEIRAPTATAVDTTGAGDALNGALAAGLAAGLGLEAAARRAVTAASLSTMRAGAREGVPTATELQAAVDQWPPTSPAQAEKT